MLSYFQNIEKLLKSFYKTHIVGFYFFIFITLCLVACNRHSEHWATITEMERIIEERPDSVLNVLQTIDTDELVGDEERAKHSLLLSMALDKNFVDKTDFEVLQPAIDYYEDNGSATDKLRTYYYQGRIYQNAGNDAAAMTSYVNALDKGAESNDKLTKARTLVAQSTIYYSLMKWDKVYDVSSEAANYYFELGRVNNYVLSLLRCISGCLQNNNYSEAIELLDKCYQYIEGLPESMEYVLFKENLGERLSMDETALSQGELYTIVSNKSTHGGKGSLVAMMQGTKSEDIIY